MSTDKCQERHSSSNISLADIFAPWQPTLMTLRKYESDTRLVQWLKMECLVRTDQVGGGGECTDLCALSTEATRPIVSFENIIYCLITATSLIKLVLLELIACALIAICLGKSDAL